MRLRIDPNTLFRKDLQHGDKYCWWVLLDDPSVLTTYRPRRTARPPLLLAARADEVSCRLAVVMRRLQIVTWLRAADGAAALDRRHLL